jgi:phospholipid/cholesterol/gamma-HCH transport system ATP-binding protein
MSEREVVIQVRGLKNFLGDNWVHRDVSFDIYRGEVVAIIGASGCGKTTLLRSLLLLQHPTAGEISLFGVNLLKARGRQLSTLRRRWGMMFQSSALFSSMDVLENVMFPMDENLSLTRASKTELAQLKLRMCGLDVSVGNKFPSELSGGMQKRAALARAIALDPELLFLDEPSAGLDPESAAALDSHLMHLRESMGLTQVMVTHDLDTLWSVPDRVMFMGDGEVLALCPMHELVKHQHPLIQAYFSNARSARFMEEV